MSEPTWARTRPRPSRVATIREGLAAGLAFAVADAVAAGPLRTPLAIILLIIATALAGGLLVGMISPRRRGVPTTVTFFGAAAVSALSIVSKDLGGETEAVQTTCLVLAGLFALAAAVMLGVARARSGSFASVLFVFAAIPWTALALDDVRSARPLAFTLGAASAPLLALLALSLAPRRRVGQLVALAALVLVALPVAMEGGAGGAARPAIGATGASGAPGPAAEDAPDVVLIIVDTLRADAIDDLIERPSDISAVGQLAREGLRFEQAISAAPWTLPAIASIFTSLYPSQHGAVTARRPLPDDVPTLAELYHAAGYETAAFTGGGFVRGAFGLDRGFEHFDSNAEYHFRPFRIYTPLVWRLVKNRWYPQRWVLRYVREFGGVTEMRERVEDWLATRDSSRPFLLVVHTYQVHDYYVYDPATDDNVRAKRAMPAVLGERLTVHPSELEVADQATLDWFEAVYSSRVRHVDCELAQLLTSIAERAMPRQLITILTSDHGEGFDASTRRVHHGGRLHDDLLRVPLLIRAPAQLPAGELVGATVRSVDLLPTLLELSGLPVPRGLAGRSLLAPLFGSDAFPAIAWGEEFPAQRALRTTHWKLIGGADGEELYDLDADPAESRPDAASLPAELRAHWSAFPERYPARLVDESEIDDETRAQLEALGYTDEG